MGCTRDCGRSCSRGYGRGCKGEGNGGVRVGTKPKPRNVTGAGKVGSWATTWAREMYHKHIHGQTTPHPLPPPSPNTRPPCTHRVHACVRLCAHVPTCLPKKHMPMLFHSCGELGVCTAATRYLMRATSMSAWSWGGHRGAHTITCGVTS